MLRYPETRTGDDADDVHGDIVADPYRWLEDAESDEVSAWITAQNEVTAHVLETVATRGAIGARLAELWDYAKDGVPFRRGERWFQYRNPGLLDQPVLYVSDEPGAGGRVLLDPNTLSEDGTTAISWFSASDDGTLFAYGVSEAGSDWVTWRVRDVESGEDLRDVLRWSKFGPVSWLPDGSGFTYLKYQAPTDGQEHHAIAQAPEVMRHLIGTDQSADELVFESPDHPEWMPIMDITHDGRWDVLTIVPGADRTTRVLVRDRTADGAEFVPVVDDFSCSAAVVGTVDDILYVQTDRGAERSRVVKVAVGSAEWETVIPEHEDTLVSTGLFGGRLLCHYLHHAQSRLRVFELDGTPVGEVDIPEMSAITRSLSSPPIEGTHEGALVTFALTSYIDSGSVWSHDITTGETTQLSSSAALDVSQYLTEQVFVTSPDGTQLPVFLTRRADVEPTGDVPVLQYGYGGFGISLQPLFSPVFATWVDRGGLLAVPIIRGGGEYGAAWHDAGRLANKQNSYIDFCAVAEWLAGSGWSRPDRIAIYGGSNGGLMVGACVTQRPELFGAAVPEVGVLDMLRFHKFTVGWAWVSDFGTPEDPEHYRWIRGYSPLHNITPGTEYPPVLVMTGDHDDRVVPAHSFKFAAAMQAAQAGDAPVLIRIETSAGHGAGKPTSKAIAERTEMLSFLEMALGVAAERAAG